MWGDAVVDISRDLSNAQKQTFIATVIGMLCVSHRDFTCTVAQPPSFSRNNDILQLLTIVSRQALPKAIRALSGIDSANATSLMSVPIIISSLAPLLDDTRIEQVFKGMFLGDTLWLSPVKR